MRRRKYASMREPLASRPVRNAHRCKETGDQAAEPDTRRRCAESEGGDDLDDDDRGNDVDVAFTAAFAAAAEEEGEEEGVVSARA